MLSVREAAKFLGVSASKLYELVSARKIVHFRIEGKILFELEDLAALKLSCRVGVEAEAEMELWNATNAHPPWSPAELAHKIDSVFGT